MVHDLCIFLSLLRQDNFFTGAILWEENLYFGQKQHFDVKMQLVTSQDIIWWTVDYLWIIVMFPSAVWTFILTAPIHCRRLIGEQVMLVNIDKVGKWTMPSVLKSVQIFNSMYSSVYSALMILWGHMSDFRSGRCDVLLTVLNLVSGYLLLARLAQRHEEGQLV